jgi:hypothetical protein
VGNMATASGRLRARHLAATRTRRTPVRCRPEGLPEPPVAPKGGGYEGGPWGGLGGPSVVVLAGRSVCKPAFWRASGLI